MDSNVDWDFAAAMMLVADAILVASYMIWFYIMNRILHGRS